MATGWIIACMVLDVAVIMANISEQYIIIKNWAQIDCIEYLLLSLSISDLISGITTLSIDSWYLALRTGALNMTITIKHQKTLSKLFDSIFLFTVLTSVFHIISLAIERLYAIKRPKEYYILQTGKFKSLTVGVIWLISLGLTALFSVPPVFSLHYKICSYVYAAILATACIIVLVIYLSIAYLLIKMRSSTEQEFGSPEDVRKDRLKKKVTIISLFLGISFVACVLPITFGYFSADLYHEFSNMMITLNSLINPCIYFAKVYMTRN